MGMECGECERDLRGGHAPDCSRRPKFDVVPWLVIRCEYCDADSPHNCYAPEDLRWSRRCVGSMPEPVCKTCWAESPGDCEDDWLDLPTIHLPSWLPA